jgi:TIR domain
VEFRYQPDQIHLRNGVSQVFEELNGEDRRMVASDRQAARADRPLRDAFISHSSVDDEMVRRLEGQLEAEGLTVWLDDSNITLGALLGRELQQSILACRVLVLLWSKAAAASRWVSSEWLMAFHQGLLVLPCVLDNTPLPQCLQNTTFVDVARAGGETAARLSRRIRSYQGEPTPAAPLMRVASAQLQKAINAIVAGQAEFGDDLGRRELKKAGRVQARLDAMMDELRARWPLDPVIVSLDGYHFKNAYMLRYWDAIQAGRAPKDTLLKTAEERFFETLALDPNDPSSLNGLANVLFFGRDLDAAEFFTRAAIANASKRGQASYPDAEHDLEMILRFRTG